ncbi:hypothetical protein FKW77_004405 [Venturia effusa]|uniref:Myb-like domain-containing protein n=1 Tax=Venturia effusa TaxID=50376 RepID=A0A517L939_9PEZI|nr:hypothetical protein FKW77_004405 [Venturia effusa]
MAKSVTSGTRVTSTWSADEDQTLLDARASGMNWKPIAQTHFPTKTPNACRKRHERLIERRNAENWGGIKAETLARQYMLFRAEIWKPLADSLGEKWQVIEAKCMEKGLKNLQASEKALRRKERGMDSPAEAIQQEQTAPAASAGAGRSRNMSIQSMLSPSPPAEEYRP